MMEAKEGRAGGGGSASLYFLLTISVNLKLHTHKSINYKYLFGGDSTFQIPRKQSRVVQTTDSGT